MKFLRYWWEQLELALLDRLNVKHLGWRNCWRFGGFIGTDIRLCGKHYGHLDSCAFDNWDIKDGFINGAKEARR